MGRWETTPREILAFTLMKVMKGTKSNNIEKGLLQ